MDFIIEKLPKDAVSIGDGFFRIGRRTYQEADAVDYSTGEVKGKVYRDIRFEYLDPTPVQIPIYLKRAETTDQRIKRLMNEQRAWEAWCKRVDEGLEDLDDFDIPDVPEYTSKYEDFLDLRREARSISDEEVEGEVKKRRKRRKSDSDNQLDLEDKIKESPEQSTKNVDKSDKIGHNKGPKLEE